MHILAVILRKLMSLYRAVIPRKNRVQSARNALQKKTYTAIWARVAKQLGGSVTELRGGYMVLECNGSWTIVHNAKVRIDDHVALTVAGNKPLIYDLLKRGDLDHLPKYLVYTLTELEAASRFLNGRDCFVVKPAYGTGGGDGVTTLVRNKNELLRASLFAASFCPEILIEEEVAGKSYRLLYLGTKLIDAIERRPPIIVGDGKSTIKRLIATENQLRESAEGKIATSQITIDSALKNRLKEISLRMSSVPAAGEEVIVKTVINQNRRDENIRVTSSVHSTFEELGAAVAKYLDLNLVGVDIIAKDISKPLDTQRAIINDINTMPGLHHHYYVRDDGQECPDVAEQVICYITASG